MTAVTTDLIADSSMIANSAVYRAVKGLTA